MKVTEHQLPSNYRVSLKALIRNAQDQILFVKEQSDEWGIPGGGIDHGETIAEGLRREVSEELGVGIKRVSANPVMAETMYVDGINRWCLWLVYEVELNAEPRIGEHSSAIGWFGPEILLVSLFHPGDKQ